MEEPKETLWRYMPFAQLVRMLQTQKLWVSHVSSFEDKLEGTLDFTHWKINPDVRKDAIENLISAFSNTYVSCWHSASSESLAMWRLYGGQGFSVAVQTEWMRLARTIEGVLDYKTDSIGIIGAVNYVNPFDGSPVEKTKPNPLVIPMGVRNLSAPYYFQFLMRKSSAFAYEKEFRAVFDLKGQEGRGVEVPFKSEYLITCVYVSPEADDWMIETVKELVHQQFGLTHIDVRRSDISPHFRGHNA